MKDNVIISNQKELDRKIETIKKDGISSLHILSDFDRTLTKAFVEGKKTPSLISHLRNGQYLTEDYAEKAHKLFNKYHPIEISKDINQKEKNKKMIEWWTLHYKLLADSGFDEKTMKKFVKEAIYEKSIILREKSREFLKKSNKLNIPIIILSSSGIGNIVTEFLKEQNLLFKNVHFIGNIAEFNTEGKFTKIKDNKVIHVFNKQESELKNLPIYAEISKRKNILLFGDSLGDLGMLEGIEFKNLISFGFMNYPEEEDLEEFKRKFDIVILNDGSFEPINEILDKILK